MAKTQKTKDGIDIPMFILLARDPLAPMLVRIWADLREQTRGTSSKVFEAWTCAIDMDRYRRQHAMPAPTRAAALDAPPSHEPRNEWRLDETGALDDVVVDDVETFRLERLAHDHVWGRVYRRDGSSTTFNLHGNRSARVSLTCEHEPAPPSAVPPTPTHVHPSDALRGLAAEWREMASTMKMDDWAGRENTVYCDGKSSGLRYAADRLDALAANKET